MGFIISSAFVLLPIDVLAQPPQPAIRAQWKAKILKVLTGPPISSQTGAEVVKEKTINDCMNRAWTELILDSEEFWKAPTILLERLKLDSNTVISNLNVADGRGADLIKECFIMVIEGGLPLREVSDVILDYDSIKDTPVKVKGYFKSLGALNYLFETKGSTVFVMLNTSELPREDRKKLLRECSKGCVLTVMGRVEDVLYSKGIKVSVLR